MTLIPTVIEQTHRGELRTDVHMLVGWLLLALVQGTQET